MCIWLQTRLYRDLAFVAFFHCFFLFGKQSRSLQLNQKIMRRQWPCCKCGFACSSTWRSLSPSKPVICNTCRSKGGKNKDVIDPNPPNKQQVLVNEGANAKLNQSGNSTFAQISRSGSMMHENVAISISQIGMIFGNLPFEPTLAIPAVILHGKSQEPKVKTEVFTADENCATGFQHHFFSGTSLKSSNTTVLGDGMIQIKQEYDCDEAALPEAANQSIWDPNKVQKRRRSKLPQYTLSPLARFINQLQHASCYARRPYLKIKARAAAHDKNEPPKYDDVLIYEKCKYVAENEIGLGAKLLSPPPPPPVSLTKSAIVVKEESSSTNESGAYFNCLIDVPIVKSGASDHQ